MLTLLIIAGFALLVLGGKSASAGGSVANPIIPPQVSVGGTWSAGAPTPGEVYAAAQNRPAATTGVTPGQVVEDMITAAAKEAGAAVDDAAAWAQANAAATGAQVVTTVNTALKPLGFVPQIPMMR